MIESLTLNIYQALNDEWNTYGFLY